MGIKGIIFVVVAILGGILNYAARPIGEKIGISELKLKITALIIVIVSISLFFIFEK